MQGLEGLLLQAIVALGSLGGFQALVQGGRAGLALGPYRCPSTATACNFALAAPVALLALLLSSSSAVITLEGAALAIASGAITSGLGYVLWYAALPGHSSTSAAVVQLAVPLIAALGGVALLGEQPTLRLVGAGALTLGGVAIALFARGAGSAARRC